VIGFGYRYRLVGDAAPDLIVLKEFDDVGFGGEETGHQRADLLAVNLGLDCTGDCGAALLRFLGELAEVVALDAARRRGKLRPGAASGESANRQSQTNDQARGRHKRQHARAFPEISLSRSLASPPSLLPPPTCPCPKPQRPEKLGP